MESNQLFSIRKAVADDVPLILQFILDLASLFVGSVRCV